MEWDRNEGRWTTILEDGIVAHAQAVGPEWVIAVPARVCWEHGRHLPRTDLRSGGVSLRR